MSKVWRWVAIAFSALMIFGIALLAVAYATGGSFERLIQPIVDDLIGLGIGIVDADLLVGQRMFENLVFDAFE